MILQTTKLMRNYPACKELNPLTVLVLGDRTRRVVLFVVNSIFVSTCFGFYEFFTLSIRVFKRKKCLNLFVCLFDLILYVPSTIFSYKGTGLPGLNQYLARINVLAQGHNAVTPVRLEHVALRSRVKHSTTEPLRSQVS